MSRSYVDVDVGQQYPIASCKTGLANLHNGSTVIRDRLPAILVDEQ